MIAALLALSLAAQAKPEFLALDGLLIGYRRAGTWHTGSELQSSHSPISFKRIGIGTVTGSFIAKGLTRATDGPEGVVLAGDEEHQSGLLFSGAAQVPRRVTVLSTNDRTYAKVVGAFLRAHGVHSPARVTRLVKVDLDGDGKAEVVIEASSRDDLIKGAMSSSSGGDYSLVLLRYMHNGKVGEEALEFDHPKAGGLPYMNKLIGIADLEGRGNMSLVIKSGYYEGVYAKVMRFNRGRITKLIENGAGA